MYKKYLSSSKVLVGFVLVRQHVCSPECWHCVLTPLSAFLNRILYFWFTSTMDTVPYRQRGLCTVSKSLIMLHAPAPPVLSPLAGGTSGHSVQVCHYLVTGFHLQQGGAPQRSVHPISVNTCRAKPAVRILGCVFTVENNAPFFWSLKPYLYALALPVIFVVVQEICVCVCMCFSTA